MRPIYRERRDALLDALRRYLPDVRTTGASAGLHVLALLPRGIDEGAVLDAAAADGVRITGLTHTYADPERAPAGLIFGYGQVPVSDIDAGVRVVARAVDRLR
jgi:GntR family transcriptional regulator/MocR family aminotransferase